jgi:NhaP-type Na+/H+ or K+/H+ antiporter
VVDERVPRRIRQSLNVESGLNDGICVPLLFAAVAAADTESEISGGRDAGTLLLQELGYGAVGGVAAGLLLALVITQAGRRGLIAAEWRQVIPVAGALLAYGIAIALQGSGFIAAFVAGAVFRLAYRRDPNEALVTVVVYVTVGLSVFAHGLTAAPLADRYARWFAGHPRERRPPMESAPAELTRGRGPIADV